MMVFVCTLFGAPAQILIKTGAGRVPQHVNWFTALAAMMTDVPLIEGYALYGVSFILLTLALKHGDLSILYPVIALTFVWVSILSVLIFHDSMNAYKFAGIAAIVVGVSVVGLAGKQ
ncbi:MAG: hypothetical protein ABI165_10080 [Bryobacteraceae bacterium]